MVTLTISERRYAEIKAGVERRRASVKVAEIEAVQWDKLPHFSSVDEFFAYLEEPPKDTAPRSRGNRR